MSPKGVTRPQRVKTNFIINYYLGMHEMHVNWWLLQTWNCLLYLLQGMMSNLWNLMFPEMKQNDIASDIFSDNGIMIIKYIDVSYYNMQSQYFWQLSLFYRKFVILSTWISNNKVLPGHRILLLPENIRNKNSSPGSCPINTAINRHGMTLSCSITCVMWTPPSCVLLF